MTKSKFNRGKPNGASDETTATPKKKKKQPVVLQWKENERKMSNGFKATPSHKHVIPNACGIPHSKGDSNDIQNQSHNPNIRSYSTFLNGSNATSTTTLDESRRGSSLSLSGFEPSEGVLGDSHPELDGHDDRQPLNVNEEEKKKSVNPFKAALDWINVTFHLLL